MANMEVIKKCNALACFVEIGLFKFELNIANDKMIKVERISFVSVLFISSSSHLLQLI